MTDLRDIVALLRWHIDIGADEAVADTPTDWTKVAPRTAAPRPAPAVVPAAVPGERRAPASAAAPAARPAPTQPPLRSWPVHRDDVAERCLDGA